MSSNMNKANHELRVIKSTIEELRQHLQHLIDDSSNDTDVSKASELSGTIDRLIEDFLRVKNYMDED
jgi:hypothetical protein